MATQVRCPNADCGARLSVPDALAGRSFRCKRCGTVIPVTGAEPTVAKTVTAPRAEATRAPAPAGSTAGAPPEEMAKAVNAPPATVGRFEVLGVLGAGAFGTVYKARDPRLGRVVAVKVPRPGTLASRQSVERFLREPRAAAQLQHPGIVTVFETGEDGDRPFIVSAFIDGQPLSDLVEAGPLGARRAAEVAAAVADALACAHDAGIVHRDVKPSNVMLDRQGRPLLMDFGLASCRDGAEALTHEGAVMGTPSYMAPEQAAGQRKQARPPCDQYSLGAMLYEMLTGITPFDGPPAVQLFHHMKTEPVSPRKRKPDVPADLETVCLKMLAKRPADRYAGCREVAEDLRRWRAGEAISARPLGRVERAVRWCRRQPALAAAVGAAAVCLLAVLALAGALLSRPGPGGRDDTAPTQGVEGKSGEPPKERPGGMETAGDVPAEIPLEQLPILDEVAPQWAPADTRQEALVKAGREQALRGLAEHSWPTLLTPMRTAVVMGPAAPPGTGLNLKLPERFILTGRLGAVRVAGGRTWVFLGEPSASAGPAAGRMDLHPLAGVDMGDQGIAPLLADYRAADPVRVVVKREKWGRDRVPPLPPAPGVPALLRDHVDELRAFAAIAGPRVYWCFLGEGLENATRPETWVGVRHGRAARLTNEDTLARSPAFLVRRIADPSGLRRRLRASFVSIAKGTGSLSVTLKITDACEGPITVRASMGKAVEKGEFDDYPAGAPVEADVIVKRSAAPRMMPFPGLPTSPDPLGPPVLDVDCQQIRVQGRPETLVSWRGPRRLIGQSGNGPRRDQ